MNPRRFLNSSILLALALSAEQETDLPTTTPTCAKCGATCEIIPTGWRCPKCDAEETR